MANQKTIDLIGQEVHTPNKARMDQHKKAKPVDITLDELKISHHNNLYDQQIEMIKKEFKECINERGK